MKKDEVKVGGTYVAKVSDKLVNVRIESTHSGGGWNATNRATGKRIHIKSAQRLRHEVKSKERGAAAAQGAPRLDRMPGDIVATAARQNCRKVGEGATDAKKAKVAGKAACLRAPHRQATKKPKSKKAGGDPPAQTGQKPKRVSALAAAAQVLAKAGKPMRAQELIAAMAEQDLWKSPAGKTPSSTLFAAMMREARDKGTASRFRKVDRGLFALTKAGA